MPFAIAITESVGGYYEKNGPLGFAVFLATEPRQLLVHSIGFQFGPRFFYIIDGKETAILRRVTAILDKAKLNSIPRNGR